MAEYSASQCLSSARVCGRVVSRYCYCTAAKSSGKDFNGAVALFKCWRLNSLSLRICSRITLLQLIRSRNTNFESQVTSRNTHFELDTDYVLWVQGS
jgi:hypothetical protein